MISFIVCLLLLITGYLTYGKIVDKTFGPDDRETPAVRINDGVDYVVMPQWKLFLVQLLNIAGLGPIFGALQGALWGPVVFLWITFGTIFAGGVHDYFSGMISERNDGASIAEVTGKYLGHTMQNIMRVFSVVLLIMVGTVFAVGPAGLIVTLCKNNGVSGVLSTTLFWLIVILVYYFIATFISIDKIIGKVYPLFGMCLIIMAVGVIIGIFPNPNYTIPELWSHLYNMHPSGTPIWSFMFITVACGAISGFHSTQSPLMARCMKNEKQGHFVFYGAMVAEGIIALIWAAAGCALYEVTGGLNTGLAEALAGGQSAAIYDVCSKTMGGVRSEEHTSELQSHSFISSDAVRLVPHGSGFVRKPPEAVYPGTGYRRYPRHRQCDRSDRLHGYLALLQLDQPDARYDRSVGSGYVPVHREEELLDGSCSGYVHECSFLHLFHPRAGVPRQPAEQQDSGRHGNLQYRSGVPDRYCIRGTAARTVHSCDQEARRKEICLNIIALLQPAVPLCGRLRPSITIIAG